mmetsp:Transcript_59014/g.129277  ORF Transcript_59014/g.129277 Transcript_59014/m.129277 type:complete len:249 (+) Transcript_59014:613-1359(+)
MVTRDGLKQSGEDFVVEETLNVCVTSCCEIGYHMRRLNSHRAPARCKRKFQHGGNTNSNKHIQDSLLRLRGQTPQQEQPGYHGVLLGALLQMANQLHQHLLPAGLPDCSCGAAPLGDAHKDPDQMLEHHRITARHQGRYRAHQQPCGLKLLGVLGEEVHQPCDLLQPLQSRLVWGPQLCQLHQRRCQAGVVKHRISGLGAASGKIAQSSKGVQPQARVRRLHQLDKCWNAPHSQRLRCHRRPSHQAVA